MTDPRLRDQRAFLRLWVARLFGTAGGQMLMMALAWQMYELTSSAWDLGLVGLLQFAPSLPLVLVAGHAVDRWHRGRIVALCYAVHLAVAAVMAAGVLAGELSRERLLLLSVVLGAVRAFQMPAQLALTPALVPMALLPRALAFSSVGMQGAIIAGPALGGLLYALGAAVVPATCVVLFVLATGLALTVRYAHAPRHEAMSWSRLLAGVHYVWGHKVLLGAVSLDLFAVLLGGAVALLPIYARDILQVGASGLGLLRAAPAMGALAMSLWLTRHALRRRTGPLLLAAVAVYGLTMVLFGLSTSFWLSMAALALGGAADMVSVVIRQSLMQLETPEDMRGRVSAVTSVFIGASNQLGEFESGATAAWLGPVGSVLLGGVGTVGVALAWTRLFPALARRDALVPPR